MEILHERHSLYFVYIIFISGHKDWFGASVLAHEGKTVACAPRQPRTLLAESQFISESSNTGNVFRLSIILVRVKI